MNDILIVRFSSLGDVVLSTAVVEAVYRGLPGTRIYILTKSIYTGLFHADERVARVIAIQGDESPLRIARMTGRERFDAVIDLHGTLRSMAVVSLISSPRKMRLDKHPIARRLMVWTRNRFRRNFDVLDSYLRTLKPLGLDGTVLPRIVPDDKTLHAASALIKAYKPGNGIKPVGLAPGARHQTKRWNEESFARLGDTLAENGYLPVFIGDRYDEQLIGRVRGMMTRESFSLAGSIDLTMTVGVIAVLRGLVTNDSGPMHIAGAVATPFVAIFGPTHPNLGFVPGYPSGSILHSGVPCSPCSIHGEKKCRMKVRFCMDGITCGMVFEELINVMADGFS
ncbi:glycosyltransferase family 9 protein [bacterium]|nr:glycosyltransferase family 9 protein [bacterium]